MQNSIEFFDMNTSDGRAQLAAHEAEKDSMINLGQQIFAKIKKSSKYYGQTSPGELFAVFIDASMRSEYRIQGGPGGQYRLADVNLFVVEDGKELRIS